VDLRGVRPRLDVFSRHDRGLAGLDQSAHRPRARCPRHEAVGPSTRWPGSHRAGPSQRLRHAISSDSLHRAPSRGRRLGRVQGRLVRQRRGRGTQLPVQGRVHPQPCHAAEGRLEVGRRCRGRRRRTSTGSTTDDFTARSGSSRQPSTRPPTGQPSPSSTTLRPPRALPYDPGPHRDRTN